MFCAPCLTDVKNEDWLTHLVIEHLDKMEHRIMTAFADVQTSIDQLTTIVNDQATQIATGTTAIEAELTSLQGGTVDLSGLQQGIATLSNNVTALAALVPPPVPVVDVPPAE